MYFDVSYQSLPHLQLKRSRNEGTNLALKLSLSQHTKEKPTDFRPILMSWINGEYLEAKIRCISRFEWLNLVLFTQSIKLMPSIILKGKSSKSCSAKARLTWTGVVRPRPVCWCWCLETPLIFTIWPTVQDSCKARKFSQRWVQIEQ